MHVKTLQQLLLLLLLLLLSPVPHRPQLSSADAKVHVWKRLPLHMPCIACDQPHQPASSINQGPTTSA
jgi:hypothetical protein